jgi:hypothetical protein
MTDLQPHRHPRQTVPLTGGARFIRGFTRIGAIAAVLVALIGVVTTGFIAKEVYSDNKDAFANAICVANVARSGYQFTKMSYSSNPDYEAAGCSDSGIRYKSLQEVVALAKDGPLAVERAVTVVGWGLMITGLVAVIAYLAFWAIGWLCAGFTRDA